MFVLDLYIIYYINVNPFKYSTKQIYNTENYNFIDTIEFWQQMLRKLKMIKLRLSLFIYKLIDNAFSSNGKENTNFIITSYSLVFLNTTHKVLSIVNTCNFMWSIIEFIFSTEKIFIVF